MTTSGTIDSLCEVPSLDLAVQAWLPLEALPRLGVPLPAPGGQVLARATWAESSTRSRARRDPGLAGDHRPVLTGRLLGARVVERQAGEARGVPHHARATATCAFRRASLEKTSRHRARGDAGRVVRADHGARRRVGAWVEFAATVKAALSGNLLPSPLLGGRGRVQDRALCARGARVGRPRNAGMDILRFKQAAGRFHISISPQVVASRTWPFAWAQRRRPGSRAR